MRETRLIELLGRGDWLTRQRVIGWSAVLVFLQAGMLLFLALWQRGVFTDVGSPPSSDFVSFYAAGKLALAGTPALAYDQSAHYAAEQHATAASGYQYFFYPPTYLPLCMALATLPYFVAFATFQLATFGLFAMVIRAILDESGLAWLVALAAFPPLYWNIGVGQNAFLTAALFGGFTLLLDRRPAASGFLLSLLCYKPHLGLLAPVALLAARRWASLLAASAGVLALAGLSVAAFGWETWTAYLAAFRGSGTIYASGRIDFAGIASLFGAARLMGFAPGPASAIQAAGTVLIAATVGLLWWRGTRHELAAATLVGATLLAAPLLLLYDQTLALVGIAWFVRLGRQAGFRSWEKLLLGLTYPAALMTWPAGDAWHIPLGPVVGGLLLLACVRRAARSTQAARLPAQAVGATP